MYDVTEIEYVYIYIYNITLRRSLNKGCNFSDTKLYGSVSDHTYSKHLQTTLDLFVILKHTLFKSHSSSLVSESPINPAWLVVIQHLPE